MRNEQQAKRNEQSATGKKVTSQEPGATRKKFSLHGARQKDVQRTSLQNPSQYMSLIFTEVLLPKRSYLLLLWWEDYENETPEETWLLYQKRGERLRKKTTKEVTRTSYLSKVYSYFNYNCLSHHKKFFNVAFTKFKTT